MTEERALEILTSEKLSAEAPFYMTREQFIEVAEKLNKWLDDISTEYQINKTYLQDVIKQLL